MTKLSKRERYNKRDKIVRARKNLTGKKRIEIKHDYETFYIFVDKNISNTRLKDLINVWKNRSSKM